MNRDVLRVFLTGMKTGNVSLPHFNFKIGVDSHQQPLTGHNKPNCDKIFTLKQGHIDQNK